MANRNIRKRQYDTESAEKEFRNMDRIINEAHEYANLALLSYRISDEKKKIEINARMEAIRKTNRHVQDAIDHFPDDYSRALVELFARGDRKDIIRDCEFLRRQLLQIQPGSGMSYGFDDVFVPTGTRSHSLCSNVECAFLNPREGDQ